MVRALRASAGRLVCGLAVLGSLAGCAEDTPARPNVLLIVVDTLRTDHLSTYGYAWETSPNLSALARRGVLFSNCTAQASWTMPSMISLMTGQPIFSTLYRIPDGHPVLAERFAAGGYRTAGFVANSLLSDDAGFDRGMSRWDVRQRGDARWIAAKVTRQALGFMTAARDEGAPFFAWLHYMDTHAPYETNLRPWERPADELFDAAEHAGFAAAIAAAPQDLHANLATQKPLLAETVDQYDAGVSAIDKHLGRLFAELEKLGLSDNTIIVLAADHGETLFRRPQLPHRLEQWREQRAAASEPLQLTDLLKMEHDGTVYEELVRTPLILAGPGIAPARRVSARIGNTDVGSTLLGLCGLPNRHGAGRDLSPALQDGSPIAPAAWVTSSCDLALSAKYGQNRKLVVDRRPKRPDGVAHPRVYDLAADPFERLPLPLDDEARELLARLIEAAQNGPFSAFSDMQADPETVERLRELGYLR